MPMTASRQPKNIAVFGCISSVTVGLFFVRSMIASMSRSYRLLNTPALAMTLAVPIIENRISGIFSSGLRPYVYKANVNQANIGIKFDLIIPVFTVFAKISFILRFGIFWVVSFCIITLFLYEYSYERIPLTHVIF